MAGAETGARRTMTEMQLKAAEAVAMGTRLPGLSESAHYQRLRRLAISLGRHRPRCGTRKRGAKTFQLDLNHLPAAPREGPHE